MPTKTCMITDVTTTSPERTLGHAVDIMEEKQYRLIPVVDGDGKFLGIVNTILLIKELLPQTATMEGGLEDLDFLKGATPGVAKKLQKIKQKKIEDVELEKCDFVHPDTPMLEALRRLYSHRGPLPVIEEDSHKLVGLITIWNVLAKLENHEILK